MITKVIVVLEYIMPESKHLCSTLNMCTDIGILGSTDI